MGQNTQSKAGAMLAWLGLYGMWGVLSILWAVLAFQVQALFVYLGILLIQSRSLTPVGWNSGTVAGLTRCGFLLWGAVWLGVVMYSHNVLKEALVEHRLLRQSGLMAGLIGAIYLAVTGLLFLLS